MRSLVLAAPLVLLFGCASAPEPAPPPQGPFAWETRPDPAEVDALRERLAPWLGPDGAACRATLLADELDLAHALLAAGQLAPEARRAVLSALPPAEAAAWSGEPAPYRVAEATLRAVAAALEAGEPAPPLPSAGWPTRSQAARAAYLQLGLDWRQGGIPSAHVERALGLAPDAWAVAQRLDDMRTLGGFALPDARARAWHRALAQQALDRGRGLVAIQHAANARAISAGGTGDPIADRALLARAYLVARQTEAALYEAEGVASLARTPTERARTEALRGEALLLAGEPFDAAEAFGRAQQAALEARDEAAVLRQALNRSVAWLKAGQPELAQDASRELQSLAVTPVGPEAPDLLARRAVIGALAALLAGELDPTQAAAQVEEALVRARAAGLVAVLDAYAGLPRRLREGRH